MNYCVYYPDEGRYSIPMTFPEARRLVRQFVWAVIVNIRTGEEVYS